MISPPSISAILVTMRFMNSRSCEVISSAPCQRLQELLQPDDRLDVEVVGRLVHQQHVGLPEQHAGQRHAHLPAARERADVAVDLVVLEARARAAPRAPAPRARSRRGARTPPAPRRSAPGPGPSRPPARDLPSRAAGLRARGADRPAGRCRRWPRPAPSGPTSPRRPGGSSRWSASCGTETSPSSGTSSPTIMRKSVVLPEPLGPTSPTFSPGFSWNEASTKISCLPYCLLMLEKEIIGLQEQGSGFRGQGLGRAVRDKQQG